MRQPPPHVSTVTIYNSQRWTPAFYNPTAAGGCIQTLEEQIVILYSPTQNMTYMKTHAPL